MRANVTPAGVALVAYLALYAAWQLTHFGPADQQALLSNVFFLPVDAAAVVMAARASRQVRSSPRTCRAWRLFALAAAAQFLGDLTYTIYELAGASPYPSLADGFYLAFYPLVLAGLLALPMASTVGAGERVRLWIDLAVVSLGGAAVVCYVVLGPTALADNGNLLQSVFTVAYPVGDVVLLVGLSALLLRGGSLTTRRPLMIFSAALSMFLVADLIYGYQVLHSGYVDGSPVDALWLAAIACFAVAGSTQRPLREKEGVVRAHARTSWLPYAAVAAGFGLQLYSDRHDRLFPGLLMTIVALTLALLVSLRQFLGQRDLLGAQERLSYQALHDGLTGLPNRRLLIDRVTQALARRERNGSQVAVFLLDVDDFKDVNDTLGHAAGDDLLVQLAGRLDQAARGAETVARLGGDEFCMVVDGHLDESELAALATRMLACFAEPFPIAGKPRRVTGSLGIVLAGAEAAPTPAKLLRDADTAMYQAKADGKGRYGFFDTEMHRQLVRRFELGQALERALNTCRIRVHYQPIVRTSDGLVLAVEALCRWTDDRFGPVSPEEFIPLAAQAGVIVPLGREVLTQAVAHLAAVRAADPRALPLGVFVNASPYELDDPGYAAFIAATLAEHGLTTADLAVELTERVFIDEQDEATATIGELNSRGVRLVLDDFGTGYSALASLERFPLYALKMDSLFMSAITTPDDNAPIIGAVVALGRALGLLVIGEGVETETQLAYLRALGCEAVQGYLLGRPQPAAASVQSRNAA